MRRTARPCCLPAVRARVAIEAAHADYWYKFVGLDGRVIGMHDFGASAPAGVLMKLYGFTEEHVVAVVEELLASACR
jgi:transketolase